MARAHFRELTDGDRNALPTPAAHALAWKEVCAVPLKKHFFFNQTEIYVLTRRQIRGIRTSEDRRLPWSGADLRASQPSSGEVGRSLEGETRTSVGTAVPRLPGNQRVPGLPEDRVTLFWFLAIQ